MPKPSIYTVGGTVQASGGIYLERKADQELLKLCREGVFAYVLTSRQLGKSSLMVRTAEQLADGGVRSVTIDLTQLGVQVSPEAWYLGLLTNISDDLELDLDVVEWWRSRNHFGAAQRLTQFFQGVLAHLADPIVIFVDEIDSTLSLPFTDDFYAAIRFLYNARSRAPALRRLTFVLIGVATPGDLINDPHRTPFNIGQQVNLNDFSFEEAQPLTEGLGMPPERGRQVLRWVLHWTGGHPYLTQRLCRTIAEEFRDDWTEAEVALATNRTFFGRMSEEDNNLQFVRDMLTKRAPDKYKLAVLETYKEVRAGRRSVRDEEHSPVKSHLKLSGIVKREEGSLIVRNPIYHEVFDAHWIKQHWPVSWWQSVPVYAKIGGGVIAMLAILAFGFALYALNLAGANVKIAQRERMARDSIQVVLNEQRILKLRADSAGNAALQSADLAAAEATNAMQSAERERTARLEAEQQRQRAEQESKRANLRETEADSNRRVALKNLNEVERRRRVDIARYLATQAQQQSDDEELGALLARQAFLFNRDNGGPWRNMIHNALLQTTPNRVGKITLRGHTAAVRAVAFSGSGENLVSGSDDGSLRLWSRQGNSWESKQTLTGHTSRVKVVAFASAALVSGSEDRTARWWSLRQDSYEATSFSGHQNRILALALSPDEQILATGGVDNTVLLWHPQNLSAGTFARLPHSAWIRALAFSADGKLLAVGCDDGAIVLWKLSPTELEKHAEFKQAGGLKSLAVHPRQLILLSGDNDGRVMQWPLDKPGEKPQLWPAHNAGVNALAFSRDGRLLATGSSDKSVKLWDFNQSSRDPILTLAHYGFVWSVALNPDATLLAAGCEDKEIYIWDTRTEALAEMVCQKVKRNLTRQEWRAYVGADIDYERTCPNLPGDGHTSN